MQSDTIIGIVGAVVLVGVMVGVFAYEFNNDPDTGATPEEEQQRQMAAFTDAYPDYAAEEDIDGDGVPNYMDDDIDGDGTSNQNDTATETTMEISGSAAAGPTGNTDSVHSFEVASGATGYHAEITYSTLGTPADNTLQTLEIDVTGPDGFTGSAGSCTGGGGSFTCTSSWQDLMPAGTYTLTVSHNGVAGQVPMGQSLSFTGEVVVHY